MATEKRLIDANALKGDFMFLRKMWSETEISEVIDAAPTVYSIEVVLCKDCKYFIEGMAIGMCKRIPGKEVLPLRYNDFCSYGERRKHEKA